MVYSYNLPAPDESSEVRVKRARSGHEALLSELRELLDFRLIEGISTSVEYRAQRKVLEQLLKRVREHG